MKLKETDELISIWQKNNRAEWSDAAFEVVKELLIERGQVLPEQNEPNFVSEEESTNIDVLQITSKLVLDFLKNHKKTVAAFCLFFVFGVFWAIVNYFSTHQIPSILSLKDNWEQLETAAHSWQTDAYLTNVSFSVARPKHYPIEAEYHSQNEPNEILFIGIDRTGKIVRFPLYVPSSSSGAQSPVYRQDWKIDSQEALNIFEKNEEIRSCLMKSSGAQILLSLNQVLTEKITWELVIIDCQGKDRLYRLDAKTGETYGLN